MYKIRVQDEYEKKESIVEGMNHGNVLIFIQGGKYKQVDYDKIEKAEKDSQKQ